MAIDIITGFNSASRESLDKRSGPYASLADAKAALDTNERYVGLRVSVISNSSIDGAGNYTGGDLTEYVFDGGITDNDLVEVITLKSDVDSALDTKPSSSDFDNIVKLTQAQYDAITTPDPNTLYIITL